MLKTSKNYFKYVLQNFIELIGKHGFYWINFYCRLLKMLYMWNDVEFSSTLEFCLSTEIFFVGIKKVMCNYMEKEFSKILLRFKMSLGIQEFQCCANILWFWFHLSNLEQIPLKNKFWINKFFQIYTLNITPNFAYKISKIFLPQISISSIK